MLKWFNTYGKNLMVGIMVVLMIAFLLQGGISMFGNNPGKRVIGIAKGEKVRGQDLSRSAAELQILQGFGLVPRQHDEGTDEVLWWTLAQIDAKENLGIQISLQETENFLQGAFQAQEATDNTPAQPAWGTSEAGNKQLAQRYGKTTPGAFRQVIQSYLVYQKYVSLLTAAAKAPDELSQMALLFNRSGTPTRPTLLSEPLIKRLIADNNAKANGQVAVIDADDYLDQVGELTEEQLQTTFDQYKDNLPQQDGRFGYQYPDRLQIQWLSVNAQQALPFVQAPTSIEIQTYFENNKAVFGNKTEYEAREQVITVIQNKRAADLAQQMIDRGRDILSRQMSQAGIEAGIDGYLSITDDFEPMSFEALAEQLTEEFGFAPNVSPKPVDDQWSTLQDLLLNPELGSLVYLGREGQQPIPMAFYAFSTREITANNNPNNPLAGLRLQVNAPSKRLTGLRQLPAPEGQQPRVVPTGQFAFFRLQAAEAKHAPEAINDDNREQVTEDTKRLAAFELLKENQANWASKVQEQGLQQAAAEANVILLPFGITRRENIQTRTGAQALDAPNLPVIGRNLPVVDAIFEAIGTDGSNLPAQGVAIAEDKQSLVMFAAESLEGVTESTFETQAQGDFQLLQLANMVTSGVSVETSPLSFDAIQKRVNWISKEAPETEGPNDDTSKTESQPAA